MAILLWDASALSKRYSLENGCQTVDALFGLSPDVSMMTTFWGYAETFSVLLRKHNRGDISTNSFYSAVSLLRLELLNSPDFGILSVDDSSVLEGIEYVQKHNLNSLDAAILTTFLQFPATSTPILITSDTRLIRAAQHEGLLALNPEQSSANEAVTFVSLHISSS